MKNRIPDNAFRFSVNLVLTALKLDRVNFFLFISHMLVINHAQYCHRFVDGSKTCMERFIQEEYGSSSESMVIGTKSEVQCSTH